MKKLENDLKDSLAQEEEMHNMLKVSATPPQLKLSFKQLHNPSVYAYINPYYHITVYDGDQSARSCTACI